MSERLSYEERDRQFGDLPLPDQEVSWQKMKELLDKDDDNDKIIPPVLFRSCFGWGMVLLMGLTVAWFFVRPQRWWNETTKVEKTSLSKKVQKPTKKTTSSKQIKGNETSIGTDQTQNRISASSKGAKIYFRKNNSSVNSKYAKTHNRLPGARTPVSQQDELHPTAAKVTGNKSKDVTNGQITDQGDKIKRADTLVPASIQQQPTGMKGAAQTENLSQTVDSTIQKKKPSQKKWILATGVGLQQPIPIAGQTAVPYSYYGREGSLADYVPSVFLQLHKKGNWFVMGEFRFGAAQSVKEFSYSRHTRYDTASTSLTVTTMRLKKTYYHQLPFSFNYYIMPNFSVGAGGMYSRFYSAISEKETDTWNTQSQTSTNFKEIIPIKHFTDSFLYKNQVHVLLQADYQWKRFSFGLRYTKDLQPYIKYTKPDGTIEEQKNQSLQLMARYRIWPGKL